MDSYFDLEGIEIIGTTTSNSDNTIELNAIATVSPMPCNNPGCNNTCLRKNGTNTFKFTDLPMFRKKVVINSTYQRYECCNCGKEVGVIMPFRYLDTHFSTRLIEQIKELINASTSVKAISALFHISTFSIYSLFDDLLAKRRRKDNDVFIPPTAIGIDEAHPGDDKQMFTVTDLNEHKLLDIRPNNSAQTVEQALSKYTQVQYIVSDFYEPYLDIAHKVCPNAFIILDKFHIIKKSNNIMMSLINSEISSSANYNPDIHYQHLFESNLENLNESDKEILNNLFSENKKLHNLYIKKEYFRLHIMCMDKEHRTIEELSKDFDSWVNSIFHAVIVSSNQEVRKDFESIRKYKEYILACAADISGYSYNNGFTEYANKKIKKFYQTYYHESPSTFELACLTCINSNYSAKKIKSLSSSYKYVPFKYDDHVSELLVPERLDKIFKMIA